MKGDIIERQWVSGIGHYEDKVLTLDDIKDLFDEGNLPYSMALEIERLKDEVEVAQACTAAYRQFMDTELMWKWFRADQLGDSKSEENAKLLKKWLDDNKDPGPAFLAKRDAIHEKLVEMTERCHGAEKSNIALREIANNLKDQISLEYDEET